MRIERKTAADVRLGKSEFIYDYASRKAVSKEFTWTNGAYAKTDEKRRVFDGLDVVQERNDQNQVTAQLVRDGNIGGILARSTQAGATFFGYDGGGNVTLLTDENGNDVGRYRYDAFGNTLEASGSRAAENPYRFSTKELHAASGLYDYGFRFYSPGLGRWINRDPIQEAGGVNLYAMVGNNPINFVDRYGHEMDSVTESVKQAIAKGDPKAIRELLEVAGDSMKPGLKKAAEQAAQRLESTADKWIQKMCKGRIREVFPKEMLPKTGEQIEKLAKAGNKAAQTARKLLTSNEYRK